MAKASKNTAYKIDMDSVVYKNAYAEGETTGIDGILETSVSWTNREEAKTIFANLLEDYTFDASTFSSWKTSVSDFMSDLSIAIKTGYGDSDGTSETPELSGLMELILSRLSPSFKEAYKESRKSEYDDVTIRDVMAFYTPSNDAQRQVDSRLASEVASGMNNVRSSTSTVVARSTSYTVQDSINKVSERAQTVGITVNHSTSPSSYVCIADEVYDASGHVDETQTEELHTSREAYETMQEMLTSKSRMYTPYEALTVLEDTIASIMSILNTTFTFTSSDTGKDSKLIPVYKGTYVMSDSLVPASEPADAKRLKEDLDDLLLHDNRVKLDTLNADSVETHWILSLQEFHERTKVWKEEMKQDWEIHNATGPRTANPPNRSYVSGEQVIDEENRRISVPSGGGFQLDDQVSVTKNTSWFEYGMKIVEIPPVGVDMGTFGNVEEIVIKSRIESVGSLSSNAEIQNPVPPAGQNAIGFYYNKHNARALSFSFELHQQEYPDEPLASIARRLDAFTRPYQYQDLHVEPRRCRIHLPGMTYEGYISSAQCSFKGDLYTSWNEGVPSSETGSVQNDTQEQYSYGILTCSLTFLIDEQIQLKQVKTDEAFSIPQDPDMPYGMSSSELIKQITDNLPVPLDAGTAQRLFESSDVFTLGDFLNVREWFKNIRRYVINSISNEEYKEAYKAWDESTGGFVSLAMAAWEIMDTVMLGDEATMLGKSSYTQVCNRVGTIGNLFAEDPDKAFKPLLENYINLKDDSTWNEERVNQIMEIFGVVVGVAVTVVVVTVATIFTGGLAAGVFSLAVGGAATFLTTAASSAVLITSAKLILANAGLYAVGRLVSWLYYGTERSEKENTGLTAEDFVDFINNCDKHDVHTQLKELRDEFVKIRDTFNITESALSMFSKTMNSISYTLPEGTVIDENGLHPVLHEGKEILIRLGFQQCILTARALAKQVIEASNKFGQNLEDTVQREVTQKVNEILNNMKDPKNDEVAEIAQKPHKTAGRLADMIQLCREVNLCLLRLNQVTYDTREYDKEFRELKQDLEAWHTYVVSDGMVFKCQYIIAECKDPNNNTDPWGKTFFSQEVSSGNGTSSNSKFFAMKDFIQYENGTWSKKSPWPVEAEFPKDAKLSWTGIVTGWVDGTCQIPFEWYLESSLHDLCDNGQVAYTGGKLLKSPYDDMTKSNVRTQSGSEISVDDELFLDAFFNIAVLLSVGVNESNTYGSTVEELWTFDEDDWDNWAKTYNKTEAEKSRRNFGEKYMRSLVSRTDELLSNLKQGLTKRNQNIEESLALELSRIMNEELHWNLPDRMKSYPEILQEILDFPLRLVLTIETIGMPWSVYDIHNDNTIGVKSTVKLKYLSPDSDSSLHELTWGEISGWVQSISGMSYDTRIQGWYMDTNFKLKHSVVTNDGVEQDAAMTMNDMFPGIEDTDPLRNSILNRISGWFYDRSGRKTSLAETLDRLGCKYPEL